MSGPRWAALRSDLWTLHRAALDAADPVRAVAASLRLEADRLVVGTDSIALPAPARAWLVAFGKAAPGMARAAIAALGDRVAGGVVVFPRGSGAGGGWPAGIALVAAGHPLPDEGSLSAGEAVLEQVGRARAGDVVVVLVSGGGSALLEAPRQGVTLVELQRVTHALQRSGADIVELNTVRRALSRIKGGGLARAAGSAHVATLALSDVVGDPLGAIASGPTVPSDTGPEDALAVLAARGLERDFGTLVVALGAAAAAPRPEAPPGARIVRVVGSNRASGAAVRAAAEVLGFRALLLTDRLTGEARDAGRLLGGIARGIRDAGLPFPPPACLVVGGETTVTVRGEGRGGRTLELALGAAPMLAGCPRTALFAFATDGLDGSSGAAGAVVTGDTVARSRVLGLSPARALETSDSAAFFEALGDLWVTGPSGTNVNDLVVLLAYP
jgi:hydroxypyruvate reductase